MNKVILMGRLTRDPEIRQGNTLVARYSLAVERRKGETDFINCVAFGKQAEFAQSYLRKGLKIAVEGRLQTGSYQRQDGTKVNTADVVIDRQEFCEGKKDTVEYRNEGFMDIPDNVDEEGLPWT